MREFYKKYFHIEDKKPRKIRFFFLILFTNVVIIYFILNKKLPDSEQIDIELKSSKLTTTLSKLPLSDRMEMLGNLDELEYIVQADVINKSQSNIFLFEAFIIFGDSIISQQKTFSLDSNKLEDIEIIFPKMKKIQGKRSYKIGVVK